MELNFFTNNIEFFIFIIILTIFLIIKRDKLEVQGKFPFFYILMYKTKLGLEKMKNWSKRHKKFLNFLTRTSFITAVSGIFLSVIFLIYQIFYILKNDITKGGGFVLPIKTASTSAPIIYVPFWYWIIALLVLVVVHEFAHGLIAEKLKIKIKSSGFAFLGLLLPIFPAAFVEPDEKILKKKKLKDQIAVFGAGSLSNFIFGILFLLLLFPTNILYQKTNNFEGLNFINSTQKSDFRKNNITQGLIIQVDNLTEPEKFTNYILKNKEIGKELTFKIKQEEKIKTLQAKYYKNENEEILIGINFDPKNIYEKTPKKNLKIFSIILEKITQLFKWISILNIGIGIMNLVPLWITDGGQITLALLKYKFKEEKAAKITNIISWFSLILIMFIIFPNILRKIIFLFS